MYIDTDEALQILNLTLKEVLYHVELMNSVLGASSFEQIIYNIAAKMLKASKPYPWGSNNLP